MRSIHARLIIGYVLVVTLTVFIALIVGRWLLDKNMLRSIDLMNAAEFQEIHNRVESAERSESAFLKAVEDHADLDEPLYYFQIRRKDGKIAFRSPNMKKAVFSPNPPDAPHCTFSIQPLGTVRVSEFAEGPYEIQIGASLGNPQHLFRSYSQVALILLGIAFVMSLFFGY